MAEYLIQSETLAAIGDQIRVLNGTEESMTPAVMNSKLVSANEEVDTQGTLIDQLSELLDGKASSGSENLDAEISGQKILIANIMAALDEKASGGGGTPVNTNTCTVRITRNSSTHAAYWTVVDGIPTPKLTLGYNSQDLNLELIMQCGSVAFFIVSGVDTVTPEYGEILQTYYTDGFIYKAPTEAGVVDLISYTSYD